MLHVKMRSGTVAANPRVSLVNDGRSLLAHCVVTAPLVCLFACLFVCLFVCHPVLVLCVYTSYLQNTTFPEQCWLQKVLKLCPCIVVLLVIWNSWVGRHQRVLVCEEGEVLVNMTNQVL